MSEEDQKIQSPQNSVEKAATSQDQNAAVNNSAGQLNQESQKKVSEVLSMFFCQSSTQSSQQATESQLLHKINALTQKEMQLLQTKWMQTLGGFSSQSTSQLNTQTTTNQPQPQQASSASSNALTQQEMQLLQNSWMHTLGGPSSQSTSKSKSKLN